ncbi:NUDIX hydrolase [Pontibacter indicus]|uniref:ADP-ribose pyrophosphatase YjhB, NUDIX family n=1 Tax=Pontibacter indicus TaxID=1317125 RepID=A0A1R3XIP8_9BACT|nr:NUDIX hydrolase [Pontibacter indicus]SIT91445.1 ADP-ribose pyrophosphatase YjhB, NUDIX family [Pontibacter indicus]
MPQTPKPDDHAKPAIPTLEQVSAGGVVFRRGASGIEVALISVGKPERWQLPKGIVDPGETPEVTAVREVQEETGISASLLQKIETIEYWYVGNKAGQRVRFHKFVHFFLLAYVSGDIGQHDWEVNEARWVDLQAAKALLSFKSERQALEKAERLLDTLEM